MGQCYSQPRWEDSLFSIFVNVFGDLMVTYFLLTHFVQHQQYDEIWRLGSASGLQMLWDAGVGEEKDGAKLPRQLQENNRLWVC